ncbi:MobH family relaxase [Serratia nevei]
MRKKVVTLPVTTPPEAIPAGFIPPQSTIVLMGTQRRQMLMEHIWQRTSLSRQQYHQLYQRPLERYAALVQEFPASESHHHAYPGGMLDHGLEIVAYALKLRQSRLLPVGTTPEDQAAQAEVWTAAIAYAALLHDLGKITVDLEVEQADGAAWHPWHGPLKQPYRFRYREERAYRLHSAATGLLYTQVLDASILDWLSGHHEAWSSLLYVLAGQYEHAGVLGELVVQADQASVAQSLGGDPGKALAAPKHALQRQLLEGLRYLLKQEFKLNQAGPSDGWLTEDTLWLVSKTVSDKLRAHLLSQGIDGIPSNNTALFTILQDHGMALPTTDGKAIWKATVTSGNGWSHTFTLLKLAPTLIWDDAMQRPPPFTGTVVEATTDGDDTNMVEIPATFAADIPPTMPPATSAPASSDAISDLLNIFGSTEPPAPAKETLPDGASPSAQPSAANTEAGVTPTAPLNTASAPDEPEVASPAAASLTPLRPTGPDTLPSGEHFLAWLGHAIQSRKLVINDAKALVHTAADTVFLVSPGIFQRYAQEHLRVAALAKEAQLNDWQWVQKQFERLQAHRKQTSGLNIWTCNVTGPRKSRRLHGYLLSEPAMLFSEQPPDNPYLELVYSIT